MKVYEKLFAIFILIYFIIMPIYQLCNKPTVAEPMNVVNVKDITINYEQWVVRPTVADTSIENVSTIEPHIQPTTHVFSGYDIPLSADEQLQIKTICETSGIEFELVLAIAEVESNYTENAIGDKGNSHGMYQIQPRWWKKKYGELNLLDSVQGAEACCVVLNYLFENYQDVEKVLQAYNSGNPNYENGYAQEVLSVRDRLKASKGE